MTPITVQIQIEDFTFDVEITHLIDQAPDPTCRDSADDFRGIREMDWSLTYATRCDQDGKVVECGFHRPWLNRLSSKHHDQIESALWLWLEAQREQQ